MCWALEQYVKHIQYVNLKKTTEKHLKFKAYAKQQSSVETQQLNETGQNETNLVKNHICAQGFLLTVNQHCFKKDWTVIL